MKHLWSALLVATSCGMALTAAAQTSAEVTAQAPHPEQIGTPLEAAMQRGGSTALDLRQLPAGNVRKRERPLRVSPDMRPIALPGSIPAQQVDVAAPAATAAAPAPTASFPGLDFSNWGASYPPDANGDVGPVYFIETVNASVGIYDKASGVRVTAFTFDALMSQGNFGNLCDTDNLGDPVVLYDTFEDRWVISDFAYQLDGQGNVVNPPGAFQCIAVSKSGDPVSGGWNFYSINTVAGVGDYPKLGVWPDAIYMSVNLFGYTAGSAFQNPRLYAFNKAQMYAGAPSVQVVSFDAPPAEFTVLPANARLQTGTPPAGSPNYFSVVAQFSNTLSVYKFHVDWNSISTSSLTGPFLAQAGTNWSQLNTGTPENPSTLIPSPVNNLDTLYPRLMAQNQYSNIGGVESLWNTHTVGAAGTTSSQAAVRYYQVKVTGGTVELSATQAYTWSPDTTVHRFMPSVAVDRAGNMALGYSASSATLNPAIRYAGRLAGDSVNTISQTETSLIEGAGSQQGSCGGGTCASWGAYSSMSLDPDGCTFWMANEYYDTNGLDWQTRIGAFKYPGASCTTVSTGTIQGTVTATVGGAPIPGATVSLGSRTTTTNGSGVYSFGSIPSGTYPSIVASATAFTSASVANVVVTDAATTVKNFSLAAAPTSACPVDTTQADFQTGVPTRVDLTSSPGNVILAAPAIDQQNLVLGGSGDSISTAIWGGQTFAPAITGQLVQADVNLFCFNCTGTAPNLTLGVRATSGGLPTGADLASATITGFKTAATGYHTAVFASPATLTAGTQYALVIRPVSNPSAGNYAFTRSGTLSMGADVYPGGVHLSGPASGTAWNILKTGGVTNDAGFKTYMRLDSGDLVSSTKDSNPASGNAPLWSTLSWTATTPANTALSFQAAASNSVYGPFNFVGPDGTSATFYTTSGDSLGQFSGKRYLQYRAFLVTTDATVTPTLSDATVCYSNTSTPIADLSIANSDGSATATPGGTGTYTITAANSGPANAPASTVADTFPASLTCTWTCVGSGGGTCTASGSGNINASVNLPNGGSVTYTATCSIPKAATGSLVNTATVTAPGGVLDPNSFNDSKTDTDTLVPQPDLSITNSDGVSAATPGGSVNYTITAANAGPSDAPGSNVTDTFPAALTCNWTCTGSGSGTCTASGSGSINDTVNLPVGGSVTYLASCSIDSSATGSLGNTASVATAVGSIDPTPGNNSVTDTDTLAPQANLSIINTDGVTTATPGGSVTYTITAANASGPSAAPGSTVTDTFPTSLTCTWTCVGSNGGTCTGSGSGNISDTVDLPKTGNVTYTASCSISAAATGTLANTASVAPSASVTDPTPGNNSVTDNDTLTPQANLSITNTDGVTTATPGGSVSYTITAANTSGPSAAPGSHVTDTFPASLTCTWTCVGSGGATCTASGSGGISDGVGLPIGGSVAYSANCAIAAGATGSLVNTATVAPSISVTDPTPGDNSVTDTDTLAVQADLALTLTDNLSYAQVGDVLDYVIEVTNPSGPSTAVATVSDALPPELSSGSWICTPTGSASCAGGSGNTLSDTATIPVGDKASYVYSATVLAAAGDQIVNSASTSLTAGTDSVPGNNSASDTDTVVIFRDGFDGAPVEVANVNAAGAGNVTAQLRVDAGLLGGLNIVPVDVASGRGADGKRLFTLQLARFGHDIALRTLTVGSRGESRNSEWQTVDLDRHVLEFAWQSASAQAADGYFAVAAGGTPVLVDGRAVPDRLTYLHISVENRVPWLMLIEH